MSPSYEGDVSASEQGVYTLAAFVREREAASLLTPCRFAASPSREGDMDQSPPKNANKAAVT